MLSLHKLSTKDGYDIFAMLTDIGKCENSFTNPVYDMSFEEFKEWLITQEQWSRAINLPEGYVGQTIYWLYEGDTPVGIGKIRHSLTDASRKKGGNIGYAIASKYRGRGYGNIILQLLLKEAHRMNVPEILLTVDKYNILSRKVIEKNGGRLFDENIERWFFIID